MKSQNINSRVTGLNHIFLIQILNSMYTVICVSLFCNFVLIILVHSRIKPRTRFLKKNDTENTQNITKITFFLTIRILVGNRGIDKNH